jgi:hypothetical protein
VRAAGSVLAVFRFGCMLVSWDGIRLRGRAGRPADVLVDWYWFFRGPQMRSNGYESDATRMGW